MNSSSPSTFPVPTRRRFLQAGGAVLLLLVLYKAAGCLRGPAVPVDVAVRKDVVETLVINGRVLAPSRAGLGAQLTGKVKSVAVEEGARVTAGQLLVALEDSEERAAAEKAAADLSQAEARLIELRTVRVRTARETLEQARLGLDEAERRAARFRALSEGQLISSTDLEDAARAVQLARSRVESAALALSSVSDGGAEARTLEAAVSAARSAEVAAVVRLAKMRVEAPAAGTIVLRSVEPGDIVQPGRVLLTMVLDREIQVLAQPDERNLGSLRVGQSARASADAFPDRSFPVEVFYVAPAVDLARGTVDVKLRVPGPPDYLRPDMTLSVEIEVGQKKSALVLPAASVRDASREPWVLVLRDGRARKQPVKLGLRGGGHVEILEGVSEGEAVIRPSKVAVGDGDRARRGKG